VGASVRSEVLNLPESASVYYISRQRWTIFSSTRTVVHQYTQLCEHSSHLCGSVSTRLCIIHSSLQSSATRQSMCVSDPAMPRIVYRFSFVLSRQISSATAQLARLALITHCTMKWLRRKLRISAYARDTLRQLHRLWFR